ncbi:MAG: hypothetical protein R8J85_03600 [Mariprofundales bacterium]
MSGRVFRQTANDLALHPLASLIPIGSMEHDDNSSAVNMAMMVVDNAMWVGLRHIFFITGRCKRFSKVGFNDLPQVAIDAKCAPDCRVICVCYGGG